MLKKGDKQQQTNPKGVDTRNKEQVKLPAQIQQQYAHAQSILMLTKLNSAYYQMHLTLVKTFCNVENRYYSTKMTAFLKILNHKGHVYEVRTKPDFQNYLDFGQFYLISSEPSPRENNSLHKMKSKHPSIVQQTMHETQSKVILKTKEILSRMTKIIKNKLANTLCFSFYQIAKNNNQSSTLKILSDKSSKIETIDSQKSKVFKRSTDKKVSKKSFSMEKSITNYRQNFIPIKYQASSKVSTPILSSQASSIEQQKQEGMTDFAKFLQKNSQPIDRRNLLSANRQRKVLKSSSSKKYNASLFVNGKQQKLRELQYLQKKYKKLITEFNWFSERFLKVIEEEAI